MTAENPNQHSQPHNDIHAFHSEGAPPSGMTADVPESAAGATLVVGTIDGVNRSNPEIESLGYPLIRQGITDPSRPAPGVFTNDLQPPVDETPDSGSDVPPPPVIGAPSREMIGFLNELSKVVGNTLKKSPLAAARIRSPTSLLPDYVRDRSSSGKASFDVTDDAIIGFNDLTGVASEMIGSLDAIGTYMHQRERSNNPSSVGPAEQAMGAGDSQAGTSDDPSTPVHAAELSGNQSSKYREHSPNPIVNKSLSPLSPLLIGELPQTLGASSPFLSQELLRLLRRSIFYVIALISRLQSQFEALHEDDPERLQLGSFLGLCLLYRYELNHNEEDLDTALDLTSFALALDEATPLHPLFIRNWLHAQRLAARRDLQVDTLVPAIEVAEAALSAELRNHPRPSQISTLLATELAESLLEKYLLVGSTDDLTSALQRLKSVGLSETMDTAMNLVASKLYLFRYQRLGNIQDLDSVLWRSWSVKGVVGNEDSSDHGLVVDTDQFQGSFLYAQSLMERYAILSSMDDLKDAAECAKEASESIPQYNFLYHIFHAEYVMILFAKFEAEDKEDDLLLAIRQASSAITGETKGAWVHIPPEVVLGRLYAEQGERNEDTLRVDEGLRIARLARKNFVGAPFIQSRINQHISKIAMSRFRCTVEEDDLDLAIEYARLALQMSDEADHTRPQVTLELARLLLAKYTFCQEVDDTIQEEAAGLLCSVALSDAGPAIVRLEAAVELSKTAYQWGAESSLEGLDAALSILPDVAWIGHRMPVRYRVLLTYASDLPTRAAALAIETGNLEAAIRHLESGRNVLWAQSLMIRGAKSSVAGRSADEQAWEMEKVTEHLTTHAHGSPLDHLAPDIEEQRAETEKQFPELFRNLNQLRRMRDDLKQQMRSHPAYLPSHEPFLNWDFRNVLRSSYMDDVLHRAANRWNSLRNTIDVSSASLRSIQTAPLHSLQPILDSGPVIIININDLRCDVIIVSKAKSATPELLPLPSLSSRDVQTWAQELRRGLIQVVAGTLRPRRFERTVLIPILQKLWSSIVSPIIYHLKVSSIDYTRIWWYPTGPLTFLPLHAAGTYTQGQEGIADTIISSYVPTLQSLIRAHSSPSAPYKMLGIGQPDTPNMGTLPGVNDEMDVLRDKCDLGNDTLDLMIGSDATVFKTKKALPEHTWLHFSCHAYQDEDYSFKSAFFLHNGPLELSQIMQLDLSKSQFAFIPACESSAGDQGLPDESIHLAASMQFAGVRSTIATMWVADDNASVEVTRSVYAHLFRNKADPDPQDAAEALHLARKALKAANIPLFCRVPFVHIGI